jgi:glycosyltransferase involved in cell wall biosynthesis
MKSRKLHWVCHSPSPYNDCLFQALAKSSEIEVQIHYLYPRSEQHYWEEKDERGYPLRYFRRRPLDWTLVAAILSDRRSLFLTACWQDLTSQLLLMALMISRRPFFVWSDCPLPRRRNWLKSIVRSKYLSFVFKEAAGVLGTGSEALREFERMGAPQQNLINFQYCVDSTRFVPKSKENFKKAMILGTVSRLDSIKGLDVAIQALARFSRSTNIVIHYRIAGAGPEEDRLKELCCNVGLRSSVEFCGWLTEDELPCFYQGLDAYLHPARFEPYGVAVMEALACGVPVLASDKTVSAIEHVAEGNNGFLHRAGSDEDLVRSLRAFHVLSPEQKESMSRSARRAALSWTPENAVLTIERLARDSTCIAPERRAEQKRA